MIVKNEQDVIEKCLDSVKDLVDEIIIVDTGSTDNTKEIIKKYTDNVFDFAWVDDFSLARNFSFLKAKMDYILWLDADDVILNDDMERFKLLKNSLPLDTNVVMMKYNLIDKSGQINLSFYRERLVKNMGFVWREPVHEYISTSGKTITSDISITHAFKEKRDNSRNLKIYESYIKKGNKLSDRGVYYYARELKDNARYDEAVKYFTSFLDSSLGYVEDNINACLETAKCYLLLNNKKNALSYLFKSFVYDVPRPEICCQLGYYFKNINRLKQAIFYFELALNYKIDKNNWGFVRLDCVGFIPCIELAVCYYQLGDIKKAAYYNEKAAFFKPDSSSVEYNRKFLPADLKE